MFGGRWFTGRGQREPLDNVGRENTLKINLGKSETGAVSLDLDRLVNSRLLLQANSGGGKSWALRRLLEQSHGHIQHLVLDIEGEFHTLREKYDYVLAARSGGDTLADVRTAPLLARRLLELGVSAILDLYELKADERKRFVRLFLESLVDAPRNLWHPVLVVVDEAHHFCPQKGEAESAAAVIDLMTRGRKRGFCGILATQRLAKLDKDAAAEANVKLIGRAGLDDDMKRASDELGLSKSDWPRLRSLHPGHFFAFGPGLSNQVIEVGVGPVETTHPRPGERAAPIQQPRAKVQAVLAKLSDLPKEAEEEAKTAAELRSQVVRLKRELRSAEAGIPTAPPKVETKIERVEIAVLKEPQLKRLETVAERLTTVGDSFRSLASEILGEVRRVSVAQRQPIQRTAPLKIAARVAPIVMQRENTGSTDNLSGPEQRILDAVAWLVSIGVDSPEQPAVAFLAGYTIGGGAYNNPRGALRTKGLIDYAGDRIRLTDAGRAAAHWPDDVLTAEELQRRVLERLPGPEQRILRVLLGAYPESVDNDDLAREAGYEPGGGAYNNPRGRLRSLGLIHYPERGRVAALPLLFLEGK